MESYFRKSQFSFIHLLNPEFITTLFLSLFFFWQSACNTPPVVLFHGFWPTLYLSHKCLNVVLEPALPGSSLSSVNIQSTLLGWALAFLGREVVHITHTLKHGTGSLPLLPCVIVNRAWKHFFFSLRRWCWCCLLCEHCQSIWKKKSGFRFFLKKFYLSFDTGQWTETLFILV